MSRDRPPQHNGGKRKDRGERDGIVPLKRRRTVEVISEAKTRPIGSKGLKSICNADDPENAILELEKKAARFEALLACEEIRPDLMKLVIRALHLLCSSNTMIAHVDKLLRSPAIKKFIPGAVLSSFINQLPYADPSPADNGPSADDKDPSPDDNGPSADDKDPSPDDNGPSPGDNDPSPNDNDPSPDDNDPSPGDNDPSPNDNDPSPGGHDPSPDDNDPSPGDNDPSPHSDLGSVITQLAEIFLALIQRFEDRIALEVPLPQLNSSLSALKEKNIIKFNEVSNLENKLKQVKDLKEEVIRREKSARDLETQSQLEPPQNFREISVIPQAGDLSPGYGNRPFLRANVTDRKYNDLEHYLDVQFRLLREDFVKPLRDGIKQLTKENETSSASNTRRAQDVPVYHDVTVLYPVCNRKGMVYRIRFNPVHPRVKRVTWEKSKRLKFGSLVCLSPDDFMTFFFATIEGREVEDLRRGELDLRFEGVLPEDVNNLIKAKETFVMLESPAYYEAYSHVLKGLQHVTADDVPFQEHIVECRQIVGPPAYHVRKEGANEKLLTFDLTNLGSNDPAAPAQWRHGTQSAENSIPVLLLQDSKLPDEIVCDSTDGLNVAIDTEMPLDLEQDSMETQTWPDRESLGFNESQMRAFQLALTKKFVVIQGPPGTGKTYVGLKIARALLQNASVWQEKKERSPILMVSYTNHALDQFLEGLLPMKGIVRVGGRSKNDKLNDCTLKSLKKKLQAGRATPYPIYRARRTTNQEIKSIRKRYEKSSSLLQASRKGIISPGILRSYIEPKHCCQLFGRRNEDKDLLYWLGIRRNQRGNTSKKDHSRNEDFRKEVSTRGFTRDDDDGAYEDQQEKTTICFANDTDNPTDVLRNLEKEDTKPMTKDEERRMRHLDGLRRMERWRLYRCWRSKMEKEHRKILEDLQPQYEEALARENELHAEEEFHILRDARVIGMTTTGAAKNRRTLQRIRPKIVLVEEAAEVLEAHIVTSLTKGCQQLILIGDHQQLRPNPAVYELAQKYKLDVSLFERMVNVGIECERLSVQHRMRPEIAALMKHIYKDLHNHESVESYEDIKGMKKNMFFINHSHLEDSCDDSHSHVNKHEASFVVALCGYLLQQGYNSDQISLLTTYTGQMFAIRDCMENGNEQLQKVRLTTVDNFQGEESDIIILSLVRSNKNEKIGFIQTENRACVALSRAKMGFYCIGNLSLLSRHSDIWRRIVADLKASGSIGDSLPLVCQIHREEVSLKTAEEFTDKVPYGGCQRPCEVRLECGHVCRKLCHPSDIEHQEYKCTEPCARIIKGCAHMYMCPNLCWQECVMECPEVVERTLPMCGHTVKVACGNLRRVECKERCDKILLSCGHRCQNRCEKPCTEICQELVKKSDWPCGHDVTIACSATSEDCPVPCRTTLECGHQCSGYCGECRMGRVHKRCKKRCGRVLVCSHECKEWCTVSCPPCSKKCENRCVHSKCDKTCGEPCVPCRENCSWKCRHHKCGKSCGELCDRPRCNKPCRRRMACGQSRRHLCRGLCGEQCICAVCHRNDNDQPITEIFLGGEEDEDALFIQLPDCKHIFAVSDLDRYMDMSQDGTVDGHMIQLKSCPRCKTAIRQSLRYGNVVKQQLQDIEKVKNKEFGDWKKVDEKKTKLKARLASLKTSLGETEMKDWEQLERRVKRMSEGKMAALAENQVTLMERYCTMSNKLKTDLLSKPRGEVSADMRLEGRHVEYLFEYLRKRFLSHGVTQRELRDINTEFTRLSVHLELSLLKHNVQSLKLTLTNSTHQEMTAVQNELSSGKRIEDKKMGGLLETLATIRRTYPSLSPMTPEERKQIVSAMGFSKGHWFKCPQGHVYAVGECGGAMQRATCPECGAVIGGVNHRLEEGNTLASEMDGASHAAWSEQANLENYIILEEI